MRSRTWNRTEQLDRVRDRIWYYLSPAVDAEPDLLPEAAALLQLPDLEVLKLARVHFLLSDEVEQFLADLPAVLRRLATTSAHMEERSTERVRGAIRWPATISARHASGLSHMYVTAPARRAYQTSENELLVFVLDAIAILATELGWYRATSDVASTIRERSSAAQRFLSGRQLLEIERRAPTASVARIRSSRNRRRYGSVIAAYEQYQRLIGELDRAAVREMVEQRALAITDNPTLFEVLCVFDIIDTLRELGWDVPPLTLFSGELQLDARHGSERLKMWYQSTPKELRAQSTYAEILGRHELARFPLRPDLTMRHIRSPSHVERWLVVEAKRYGTADAGIREALKDLLAYRQAYRAHLSDGPAAYGWGIAWGSGLQPADGEVMLSTPDHIRAALQLWLP